MEIQWSLVLFTLLTGTAGWMFVCLCVDEFVKKAQKSSFIITLIAIIVAVGGGIASVTHLSHPDRMLNALQHPTSGIFIEAVLTGCLIVCAIIFIILVGRKANPTARKVFGVITAAFGIAISFMAGQSYMMESRAAWDTWLLPLGYMGTVIPAGVGAYVMIAGAFKEFKGGKVYGIFLAIGGAIGLITSLAYILGANVLTDETMVYFVIAIIGAGVIPLICGIIIAIRQRTAVALGLISLICALAGALCFRCIMYLSGEAVANLFGTVI